jgi:hypothetical protein
MRRLASIAVVAALAVLGFGSAYVLAKPGGSEKGDQITICHSGSGTTFTRESPSAEGVLSGHVKNHEHDIIPPFDIVKNGTTTAFPGQNMNTLYGAGFTGAEVLANGCSVPTRANPAITQTETTTAIETVPITATVQEEKVTAPAQTSTTVVTATVSVPAETTSVPPVSTVVTVAPEATTAVTLPAQTAALPAETETVAGETIVRPAETVTLPGSTTTVTAPGTTTAVTVTGPSQVARESVVATQTIPVAVTTPRRVVRVRAHPVRLRVRAKVAQRKVLVVRQSIGCRCRTR